MGPTMVDRDLSGETPQRIFAAADELFGEVGFDGVSMRDVAQKAGVNKALVFYHFGGKEPLFETVLQRYYTAHRAALKDALAADLPQRERFHGLIDAYLDFIAANRHYPRLVQRQVAGSGAAHALIEKNLAELHRWTVDALSDIAPADGPKSAKHLFVTLAGAVINYFTYGPVLAPSWGSDPLSCEGIAERREHLHWLTDALLDGLQ